MDEADLAQRYEEAARADALAAVRGHPHHARGARRPPGEVECVECGEEIPAERLAAQPGARRCVECQAGVER